MMMMMMMIVIIIVALGNLTRLLSVLTGHCTGDMVLQLFQPSSPFGLCICASEGKLLLTVINNNNIIVICVCDIITLCI